MSPDRTLAPTLPASFHRTMLSVSAASSSAANAAAAHPPPEGQPALKT